MSSDYNPPNDPLDVIHQDHELIVVNKPSGLLSVPGRGEHLADCMLSRLQAVFPEVLLVHRLDRDTSGVMVFAMTPHAQRNLSRQFEDRKTKKIYVARVWGVPSEKTGTVDLPLIVDWPNRPKQMVDHENGKPAITDWRLMKVEGSTARIRLMPQTGRSHQLRVHMQAIGHPILGDPFYAEGPAADAPRLMLHAQSLRVAHPDGGKGMTFTAKCPF